MQQAPKAPQPPKARVQENLQPNPPAHPLATPSLEPKMPETDQQFEARRFLQHLAQSARLRQAELGRLPQGTAPKPTSLSPASTKSILPNTES
jgi:hypothetical protein